MADNPGGAHRLVASFFTLSGGGFVDPPRHSFAQRCEAAARAGFAGIGLHADDLPRNVASGVDAAEMRAILRLNGLELVEIEFLAGWARAEPPGLSPALPAIEAIAAEFGGRHVSAGEFSGDEPLDTEQRLDRAAAALQANAQRLAEQDLLVAVEAFPWSALSKVETAVDLIRRAGAPANTGLMIDVWHFYNSGASLGQLQDLPGAGVAAVQLNDGPLVHEDFLTHARAERMLPGDGDLDVVGLIRAVRRNGYTGPYCVEVNTPAFRALPVSVAAERAAISALAVLNAASLSQ